MNNREIANKMIDQLSGEQEYPPLVKLEALIAGTRILLGLPDAIQSDGRIIVELDSIERADVLEYAEAMELILPEAQKEYETLMKTYDFLKEMVEVVKNDGKMEQPGKYINDCVYTVMDEEE